jgi:hypothetical protein
MRAINLLKVGRSTARAPNTAVVNYTSKRFITQDMILPRNG